MDRAMTAAMVEIAPIDPAHPDAQQCLHSYFSELDRRFDKGFDPAMGIPAQADEMRPPAGLFLVASLGGDPIGCGALKFHGSEPADIRRMWVAESARGLGIGRRLLGELEDHAARNGVQAVRLETNRALDEAVSLYRSAGYVEVPAFNDEPYAHHWFEKQIMRFNLVVTDLFEKLAGSLDVGGVTKPAHPTQPQRMNANAFCVRNRVFAMRVGDDLVLKLAPKRVAELIEGGVAGPHVVGGRPMAEWATFPPAREKKWLDLTRESLEYVRNKR